MAQVRYTNVGLARDFLSVVSQQTTDITAYRSHVYFSKTVAGIMGFNLQEYYEEHGRFPEGMGIGSTRAGILKLILDKGFESAKRITVEGLEKKARARYQDIPKTTPNIDAVGPAYSSSFRTYDRVDED